jgi:hypothetical protein
VCEAAGGCGRSLEDGETVLRRAHKRTYAQRDEKTCESTQRFWFPHASHAPTTLPFTLSPFPHFPTRM